MAVALQMACVSAEAPSDRRLGLVMTHLFWSVYQTDDASEECPEGFNDGPREQFAALYPQYELLSVETTQLRQEVATWLPSKAPDGFLFKEASGPFSWGIDLDGAVGDEDYTTQTVHQELIIRSIALLKHVGSGS